MENNIKIYQPDFNKPVEMKGHDLIIKHKNLIQQAFPEGGVFIEIGSERGCGSTDQIADICTELGFDFHTVDVNVQTSAHVKEMLKMKNTSFQAHNEYGEKFLKEFPGAIHVMYLDAFDYEAPHHSPERRNEYASRGYEINAQNCWQMHLECVMNSIDKMPKGGFIFFDDVYTGHPDWEGKGKTAIDFILKNGFELLEFTANAAGFIKK